MKPFFRNNSGRVFSICICMIISILSIANYTHMFPHIQSFCMGVTDFETMRGAITEEYNSNRLWNKYEFVNLFGLFMKKTGRRVINEVVVLNNGMLSNGMEDYNYEVRQSSLFTEIPKFSDYLNNMGSKFIYIAAPFKLDIQGELLPKGLIASPNLQTNSLLGSLNEASVETIDLRQYLANDADQIEKYFYRTDHHWTPDGALVAFKIIMDRLKEDDPSLDISYTKPALWERHAKENWFLGSRGKRTGVLCAGVDPLIWYTPRFDTTMSCVVPHHKQIFKGDFVTANIRQEFIDNKNYFNLNNYCVYIGGDYPYVKHINPDAPNKKKLLILKDSFMLPLQAFLSTEFTEVEVIDPRHYTASGISEYCMWNRPDIVLMMVNAITSINEAYARLGNDNAPDPELITKTALLQDYDVIIEKKNNQYNYIVLPVEVQTGKTYQLSFRNLKVTGDNLDGVSFLVFDFNSDSIIRHQIFDVTDSLKIGDNHWTFRIPPDETENHDYRLLMYAGVPGNTIEKSAICSGICVYELK